MPFRVEAKNSPPASNTKTEEVPMYVILGAGGNTGHIAAKTLLSRGKKVRAVGRSAEHLQPLMEQGAEAFIANINDESVLAKAFDRAEAAYVMIPPNPASNDPSGYQERISDSITNAARKSGVHHIVALSSIGADKSSGTGPVVGIHNFEQKLNQLAANVLHLRAGYFMENTLPQVGIIRAMHSAVGPLRADLKVPMIASQDIGAAAADFLTELSFQGKQTQELLGQRDLDYSEATTIIGDAIGRPKLGYIHAPDDQIRLALVQTGMSDNFAGLILEMASALNSGHMRALEPRSPRNTTPTPFKTFVTQRFVPAYQEKVAA
jgi:uncharacterized protein YbjT (DUF2867 family)